MRVDIGVLPKNPDAAFIFMVNFLEKNAEVFFSSRTIRKQNQSDFKIALRLCLDLYMKTQRFGFAGPAIKDLEVQFEQMNRHAFLEKIKEIRYLIEMELYQEDVSDYDNEVFFELKNDDVAEIQKKLTELREEIYTSDVFDEEHKSRLLARISLIEREIYKKRGRYDTILAGIADFGLAMGDFGKNVKPFVDRIIDITKSIKTIRQDNKKIGRTDEQKKIAAPKQ